LRRHGGVKKKRKGSKPLTPQGPFREKKFIGGILSRNKAEAGRLAQSAPPTAKPRSDLAGAGEMGESSSRGLISWGRSRDALVVEELKPSIFWVRLFEKGNACSTARRAGNELKVERSSGDCDGRNFSVKEGKRKKSAGEKGRNAVDVIVGCTRDASHKGDLASERREGLKDAILALFRGKPSEKRI